jgi:hypothetical protein
MLINYEWVGRELHSCAKIAFGAMTVPRKFWLISSAKCLNAPQKVASEHSQWA